MVLAGEDMDTQADGTWQVSPELLQEEDSLRLKSGNEGDSSRRESKEQGGIEVKGQGQLKWMQPI